MKMIAKRLYSLIPQICLGSSKLLARSICCSATRLQELPPQFTDHTAPIITPDVTGRRLPLITGRKLAFPCPHRAPKQAWLESLDNIDDVKLGLLDLHPEVFGAAPRIDILWRNIQWQLKYKTIDYRRVKSRAEMVGSKKKPWPQKGTGRARHGSRFSPIWVHGGACYGPRGPTSRFFMLSNSARVQGLCGALSAKFAQENLHIVESLDIPTDNPQYLEDLVESRGWGLSVLFVNHSDQLSENMALALAEIDQYNALPVYGVNVYSLLKHETLVMTLPALEDLETKLLQQLHKVGPINQRFKLST